MNDDPDSEMSCIDRMLNTSYLKLWLHVQYLQARIARVAIALEKTSTSTCFSHDAGKVIYDRISRASH